LDRTAHPDRVRTHMSQTNATKSGPIARASVFIVSLLIALISGAPQKAADTSAGPESAAPTTTGTVVPLTEGFEGGLDTFTSFSIGCATTHCLWGSVTSDSHSGGHSAYAADVAEVGDDYLIKIDALAIPANAASASLTFWHRFDFENAYDGGVLEASIDGGATWTDAAANITVGAYNGTISSGFNNPLAGRSGWVGSTGTDWQEVQLNLLPYRGPSFLFRLRIGTDSSNSITPKGWWVDDVQVSYDAPLSSCDRGWSTVSNYPAAVRRPATIGLGGLVYSFGGQKSNVIANAYTYAPGNDTWTPIASLPTARYAASAVTDGTYIYVLGGADSNNTPTSTLWRYDPGANSYVTLASFTTATAGQAAVYLNDAIYRIAGSTDLENGISTATVEVYAIATNTWAPAANYPQSVFALAALPLNGYIYTAGGNQYLGDSAKTYRYDPNSGIWDDGPIADLPGPMSGMAGALYNGNWILAGSQGGSALAWSPAANEWRSLDQMPQRVFFAGGGVAAGAFYTVGGIVGGSTTNVVQQYGETDCATPTSTVTPTPTATQIPSATPTQAPTSTATQMPTDTSTTTPQLPTTTPTQASTSTPTPMPKGTSTNTPEIPTTTPTQASTSTPNPIPTDFPTRTPPRICTGDCDGDGTVTINELIMGVNIALGSAPLGNCSAYDKNGDGVVAVDELITAVNAALNGCN